MAKDRKVDGPESKMFKSILETQSTHVSINFRIPEKNKQTFLEKERIR